MARNLFCSKLVQKGVDAPPESAGFWFGAGNVEILEIPASNSFSKVRFHYKWLALCGMFFQLCFALHFAAHVEVRQCERT